MKYKYEDRIKALHRDTGVQFTDVYVHYAGKITALYKHR